jgi:hypothetical protein
MNTRVLPCVECAAPVDADIHEEELGLCLECSNDYWGHTGAWSDSDNNHEELTLYTERIKHSGAWIVSAIISGYRVANTYYGYTEQEAINNYRATHTERNNT